MKIKLFFTCLLFIMLGSTANISAQNTKFVTDSISPAKVRIVEYKTVGVCSKLIHIEVDKKNVIQKVEYTGGCNGNLKGIGKLVEGMKVEEAIKKLKGTTCGKKESSCPDQLAIALEML